MLVKLVDVLATAIILITGPLLRAVGNFPGNFPLFQNFADRIGVQLRSTHYYHPTYANADLPADVTAPRELPGVDLQEQSQIELLGKFNFQNELARLSEKSGSMSDFSYDGSQYSYGDADLLYAMIRHLERFPQPLNREGFQRV